MHNYLHTAAPRLITLFLIIALIFSFAGCGGGKSSEILDPQSSESSGSESGSSQETNSSEQSLPENQNDYYDGVKLADNVSADMLNAEYWLPTDADSLLMDKSEISSFNSSIITDSNNMYDLASLSETMAGSAVQELIRAAGMPKSGKYVNGSPMKDGYLTKLEANRAVDSIPSSVKLRYGVTVGRTEMYIAPTDDFISSAGDLYYNDTVQTELYWNEPVIILSESADGAFYFVLSYRYAGWTPSDKVALFESKGSWLEWQQPEDFLVVTAKRLRLDYNALESAVSEQELTMGTVLPIAPEGSKPDDAVSSYGCHVVMLPIRSSNGNVRFILSAISANEDLSRGYLACTQRNIIVQAFKLMGQNYGWGGTQSGNDCSGILSQIFRTMGIFLPRNSGDIKNLPCSTVSLEGLDAKGRGEALEKVPTGAIVHFAGHVMLYLGQNEGRFYVLSAVGDMVMAGSAGSKQVLRVIVNDLDARRGDGDTWLNHMTCAKIIWE